jgi:hypothetical protein
MSSKVGNVFQRLVVFFKIGSFLQRWEVFFIDWQCSSKFGSILLR